MNFYKKFSTFNKIFFIIFLIIDIVLFIIPAIQKDSISVILTPLAIMTFISSLSALLMAIYNSKADVIFFIWSLVNTISYTYITYEQNLYGQVILTAGALFPIQVTGLFLWIKVLRANHTKIIDIKTFNRSKWINYSVFFVISCIIYALFIFKLPYIMHSLFGITISPDSELIIDSVNAMATLFAVLLGAERYIEQWFFWMIANTTGILMFVISFIHSRTFSLDSISTATMWLQLEINAFYGYAQWKKFLANQKSKLLA